VLPLPLRHLGPAHHCLMHVPRGHGRHDRWESVSQSEDPALGRSRMCSHARQRNRKTRSRRSKQARLSAWAVSISAGTDTLVAGLPIGQNISELARLWPGQHPPLVAGRPIAASHAAPLVAYASVHPDGGRIPPDSDGVRQVRLGRSHGGGALLVHALLVHRTMYYI
jgi:hypothetical protein